MKGFISFLGAFRKHIILVFAATIASFLFVWLLGAVTAAKLTNVEYYNARDFYYTARFRDTFPEGDSIIVYSPYVREQTNRDSLVAELDYLCSLHPKAILFDYVLEHFPYTSNADDRLISVIKRCQEAGIFFAAPIVDNAIVKTSFFHDSLDVPRGNVSIYLSSLAEIENNEDPWLPGLIAGRAHPKGFFKNKNIDFSRPKNILTVYRDSKPTELSSIKGKYVVFSDSWDRGDIHPTTFPVQNCGGNSNDYNYSISGATYLWYALRAELNNKWDTDIPFYWSFLIILFFGILFSLFQDYFDRKIKNVLLGKIVSFAWIIFWEVILIPLIGIFFMYWHNALPLIYLSIAVVFIDLFHYEKQ